MIKRLLRPLFRKAASLFGIPELQKRLDDLDVRVSHSVLTASASSLLERRATDISMAQMNPLLTRMSEVESHVENRLISLNDNLVSFVDAKQQQNEDLISQSSEEQKLRIKEIRESVDTIRRQLSAGVKTTLIHNQSSTNQAVQVIDDAMYVALENHFRGSRDIVAQRQSDYLPLLPLVIDTDHPLVDLGCGRGEWLKVLREKNIPSIGVDSNGVCIAECKEEKLRVVESDLLEFLRQQPDNSVGAYTLFQVLEHLPFSLLLESLREMKRSLIAGGVVIAEVPNAKNLRVSAGTFWIDPTHQRPLFPELLIFLALEVGFSNADGKYTNNLAPEFDLSDLSEKAAEALRSVLEAVDGPGDFALIATA